MRRIVKPFAAHSRDRLPSRFYWAADLEFSRQRRDSPQKTLSARWSYELSPRPEAVFDSRFVQEPREGMAVHDFKWPFAWRGEKVGCIVAQLGGVLSHNA